MSYGHQTLHGVSFLDGTNIQQITFLLAKSYFQLWIFLRLRIVPLILHRATVRLLLLVREKELPILTSLNFYVTLSGIHGSIW